jgi:hypothetical protein
VSLSAPAQYSAQTRPATLDGGALLVARAAGVVVAILLVGLSLLSIPLGFQQFQTVCTPGRVCADGHLMAADVRALAQLGLSKADYAAFAIALRIMVAAVFGGVAAAIAWRRSRELMAFYSAFMLATFGGATFPGTFEMLTTTSPLWQWPVLALEFLGSAAIIPYFYLFPDGRFVPRWSRWLALVWILAQVPLYAPNSPVKHSTGFWFWLLQAVLFVGILSAAVVQVYRYRHVSTPLQRQQTKVVVFGTSVALVGYLGVVVGSVILDPALGNAPVVGLAVVAATFGLMALIPISIGVAILRYRLWDIDVVINKALVYGVLTLMLGVIYVGGVVWLQGLLRGIVSQDSTVAVVISTLAIATLFQPLRHRIQTSIDRRFYRRKYDAAQALAAFGARLRYEVDLKTLTDDLLDVVNETVQPTHVSLWLRTPEQRS